MLTGDFNRDGKLDLVASNFCTDTPCSIGSLTLLLGNGDGTFRPPVPIQTGAFGVIGAGDLNGDGSLDLVVTIAVAVQPSPFVVFLGNGDGTFTGVPGAGSAGPYPSSMVLADFDGDGKLDLAVANPCGALCGNDPSGAISILLGIGDGTFTPPVRYTSGGPGATAQSIVAGDFNRDGKQDLAIGNGDSVGVLLGRGNGTFMAAVVYEALGSLLGVGDFNGDGQPDLIANRCDFRCFATVLLGAKDGTFRTGQSYELRGSGSAVADFRGNGKFDLATSIDCFGGFECQEDLVAVVQGNGDGTFLANLAVDTGGRGQSATSVTVADFNGDGKPDIAVPGSCRTSSCGVLAVSLADGQGNFKPATQYITPGDQMFTSAALAVADFNADGKPDIAETIPCVNDCPGSLLVFLGDGNGVFSTPLSYALNGFLADSVAAGDFNGDGKADLVVGNACAQGSPAICQVGSIDVFLGNGDGTFQPPVSYSPGAGSAAAVAVGDLNGDGRADLVVSSTDYCSIIPNFDCLGGPGVPGSVGLLLGNGDGTFQPVVSYSRGGPIAAALILGDFNGDGKLDVVVSARGLVGALLGNGDGSLQSATTYPTGELGFFNSVKAADLDGDGKLDLIVANRSVLRGNGDGTFQSLEDYNPGKIVGNGIAIADFNGDGKPDAAVAGDLVTILSNISSGFQQNSSTTLASSRNPAEIHQRVTFTAKVRTTSQGTPGGSITFSDNGHALASVSVANGRAKFSTSSLDGGIHSITASYSGDQTFQSSTSPELKQVVRVETRIRLASSQNPSSRGQAVTFTVTVAANSGETPTGKITFRDLAKILGTVELSEGQAIFTTSTLRRGLHLIRADYGGDTVDHRSFGVIVQKVK